jgi:ATP-dependent helicase HepA
LDHLELQDEPLDQLAVDLKNRSNRHTRIQRLVDLTDEFLDELEDSTMGAPKLVAFSSSTAVARDLADELRPVIGHSAVFRVMEGMSDDDVDDEISDFEDIPQRAVLICDRTGEEGLNLQFAHGIIHLDLPMSAARLQQRIGRLDRFGRSNPNLSHRVILISKAPGNPWLRWYNLISEGFELFNKPVSDVQFILEDLETEIVEALANNGPDELVRMIDHVKERLATERIRLDEQYALDSMVLSAEAIQADALSVVDEILSADLDELAAPISEWLTDELKLTRRSVPGRDRARTFKLSMDSRAHMPAAYADNLAGAFEEPLTRFRDTALVELGTRLIRPGTAIVDGTADLLKVDERGKAFATWRMFPAMNMEGLQDTVVFRLSYHAEVDAELLSRELRGEVSNSMITSIVRRADTLFRPISETINVASDLTADSIPMQLREVAAGEYDPTGESDLWRDSDLIDLTEILDAAIDPVTLQSICDRVISDHTSIWSNNSGFPKRIDDAQKSANINLGVETKQLERRKDSLTHAEESGVDTVEREIRINDAISKAVSFPKVELDSVGLIVISGRTPSLPPEARTA